MFLLAVRFGMAVDLIITMLAAPNYRISLIWGRLRPKFLV